MKCFAPWHSILVRFNGDIVPDGVYTNRYGNLLTHDLKTVLNSSISHGTKQAILNNTLPPECQQCVKKEKVIGHSRRIFFKDTLNPLIANESYDYSLDFFDIRFLEFNMSNVCNLKCRMCSGVSSTAWVKEDLKLASMNSAYDRPINHPEFGYQNVSETIIDRLFEYPEYFKNLSYVSIKGGEPYMDPANKTMMRRLIEMNLNQNITLDVTTNGTIVDEEFHTLARQFNHTKWTVSLEAVGKLYEYIRGGKNFTFEELTENIKVFEQFDRVIIAVTVMTYNICHLKEIKEWYDSVKKDNYSIYFNNVVATPSYLNPSLLPQSILDVAREHNNIDINYSHDSELRHLLPTFVSFTKDLDTLRETDVLAVCPEFKQLFTE